MKKIIIFIFSLFVSVLVFTQVQANSDYINDYTYVDCQNGDDATAIPFDSSKPYSSLAAWIQATTDYINSQDSIKTASWAIFHIKASCNIVRNSTEDIWLNFYGINYGNSLIIEWIGDEGLILSDVVFTLPFQNGWGIIFKNVKFIKNSLTGYYFARGWWTNCWYGDIGAMKIIDSYIKLNSGTQIGGTFLTVCTVYYPTYYRYDPMVPFYITNSLIDIDSPTTDSYQFLTPTLVKDSKITFWTGTTASTITFTRNPSWNRIPFGSFISDEINLGWNNFQSQNSFGQDITFINNKFLNVWEMSFTGWWIYLNNLIENSWFVDISTNKNVYNNVFSWNYSDVSDPHNLRKNYNINSVWPKGVGWVFRKITGVPKDYQINYSSTSLYKEITGKVIPNVKNAIYLLFD